MTVVSLHSSRGHAIKSAFAENTILARSLASYSAKVLDHAKELSAYVADAYVANRLANVALSFADRSPLTEILVDVAVYEGDGRCVWTLAMDCAKLNQYPRRHDDDLRAFQNDRDLKIYVSRTFTSTSLKRQVFFLSRAIRSESGDLSGFVRVMIDPLSLSRDFYSLLRFKDSRISISGLDGYTRIRLYGSGSWSSDEVVKAFAVNSVVSQIPSGAKVVPKASGGTSLAAGWQKLKDYPIYITVSSPLDDILVEHRKLILLFIAGLSVLCSLMIFLYWSLAKLIELGEAQGRHSEEKMATLRQVSDLKSDIVNVVAHELRSPLSSIMGFAELIAVTTKEEETRDYANTALEGARKLTDIVNNMLDLARLNDGDVTGKIEQVELSKLLFGFQKLFQESAQRKSLELQASVPEEVNFRCDAGALGRIVSNLIQNSIKFTERGSVTLRGKADQGGVSIEVEDTGIGIPADDLPQVFGRFSKIDSGRHPQGKGAGLGLALVKETVDALGGRITLRSKLDEGTCVSIWIPAEPPTGGGV